MKNYSLKEFEKDIEILASKINPIKYSTIHPIPRGGIPVALALSNKLNIPLSESIHESTLIVDDLVASGKTMSRYKNDIAVLHIKKITPKENFPTYWVSKQDDWIEYWWEKIGNEQPAEDAIIRIIEMIGDDPNRPGLIDTPKRITKMYKEIFRGYDENQKPKITIFENHKDGIRSAGILRDSGYFFSFCEHHILPFFGHYWFGYIPDKLIMGASKIARLVDYYSAKLQVAERLCYDIIEEIEKQVNPKGSILIMNARHLCKEMRGVKKFNSPYETNEVRGFFLENKDGCKDEFLSRIKG